MEQNNPGFVRFQPGEQISVWRAACALSGQSWAEATPAAATIEKAQLLCQKIVEGGLVVHKSLAPLIGSPVDLAEKWKEDVGLLRLVAYSAERIGNWNHMRNQLVGYSITASAVAALAESPAKTHREASAERAKLKKQTLVAKYEAQWQTIDRDIAASYRKGHWLRAAKVDRENGFYYEETAIQLAKERGKFRERTLFPTSVKKPRS
jgi:hypothetical protein